MVFVNFRENIELLLKLKESLIPQIDGNFINNWESEATKYQHTSETILIELKEIRVIEGFVSAISSQLVYLRRSLSNYSFMADSEKDQFKRLYVLSALGLIAKLKLIMFFSTYINYNDNINYVHDLNLNDTYFRNLENNNNYENEDLKECHSNKNQINQNTYNNSTGNISEKNYFNNIVDNNNHDEGQNEINMYNGYITHNDQNDYKNPNDYRNKTDYNKEKTYINNKNEIDVDTNMDTNMDTNNIYNNNKYMNNLFPYTNTLMNKNMHKYIHGTDIIETMDSFHNGQMIHAENVNTANEIRTKENSNIKECVVNKQPTINMANTCYTNDQINNYKNVILNNIYNNNPEQTEFAAQQIYEILTDMESSYRTPSSSVSSTVSSANKNSYNYNGDCYIPNNQYYQFNGENSHLQKMTQCFQTPNLIEGMYGNGTYY